MLWGPDPAKSLNRQALWVRSITGMEGKEHIEKPRASPALLEVLEILTHGDDVLGFG